METACYCQARKRKQNGQIDKVVNKYTSYSIVCTTRSSMLMKKLFQLREEVRWHTTDHSKRFFRFWLHDSSNREQRSTVGCTQHSQHPTLIEILAEIMVGATPPGFIVSLAIVVENTSISLGNRSKVVKNSRLINVVGGIWAAAENGLRRTAHQ